MIVRISFSMEWYLAESDYLQKYREYRWLLQFFQSQAPAQRLIMKSPAHTGNLNTLKETIPEAMVIQTHRDPVTCVISVCSLIYTYHRAVTNKIQIQEMINLILRLYESWFRRSIAYRETHPDVVYDVYFNSLVSDPVGTVRGIYSHYDLPWTDAYESDLTKFIQQNPKDKHGKHRYSASDFGLTETEIADRFQFYSDRFGLSYS